MYVVQSHEEHVVLVRDEETGTQLDVLVIVDERNYSMLTCWNHYEYFLDVAYDEKMLEFMDDEDNMKKFFSAARDHVAELKGWN